MPHRTRPTNCAYFEVTRAGLVDYDASLDDTFEGRGTATLRARGTLLHIDPTALDAIHFNLQGGTIG